MALTGSAPPSHRRTSDLVRAVQPALAALSVAAAALTFRRVYDPATLPVPVLVGTVLGALAAVACARLQPRWRSLALVPAVAVAAVVAGLVTVAAATDPRAPLLSGTAFAGLRSSVVGGTSRVLTTTLPAPSTPGLLPQVAVLCAVAAGLAVALARVRGLLAFAPGAAVLVLGLVCGVGGPGSVVAITAPYAAIVAVALVRSARSPALPVALVAVVGGVALGAPAAHAVDRHPYDPRDLQAARITLAEPPDPLALLPGWLLRPTATVFTARVDPAWLAQAPDWRLASFDTYDGESWTSSSPAVSIGYQVDDPPPAGAHASAATVAVTTTSLPGVYVPTAGPVRAVDRADLAYDLEGGSLVDPRGVAGGTFAVTSDVPDYSVQALAGAGVATDAAASAALATPSCTPAALTAAAQTAVGDAQQPVAQAQAIATYLSQRGGFASDPNALSGHSCGRLAELFTGDRHGTSEQFATAFVLMARSVGLPARLAVGFRAGTVAGDVVTVHTGDALAWPEVDLADVGWVPFDPVPRTATSNPQQLQKAAAAVSAAGAAAGSRGGSSQQPPRVHLPAPATHRGGGLPWWALALVALGGALLVVPVVAVGRKALRRRRRRRRGTLGAWAELLDRLGERGVPTAALTTREVHRLVRATAPAAGADSELLADLVDAAIYAPEQTSAGSGAAPAEPADTGAWSALAAVERAMRAATRRGPRLRHRLHPLLGTAP